MTAGLLELVGLFVVVVGCGLIVASAAFVSVALAVLVAGVFAVFLGVVVVYTANQKAVKP